MTIRIKRIYDPVQPEDGYRVLADRLWPRGISKQKAELDEWPKKLAPSNELRHRFKNDGGDFDTFKQSYQKELSEKEYELKELLGRVRGERMTLLYASKDTERNNAVVLQEYLETLLEE